MVLGTALVSSIMVGEGVTVGSGAGGVIGGTSNGTEVDTPVGWLMEELGMAPPSGMVE